MDESLRLSVHLDGSDDDPEAADEALRDLLFEVREHDVDSAVLEARAGPPGSKGADLAGLVVQVAPTLLSVMATLINRRMNQTRATVRFEGRVGGQRVKFEGSPSEFVTMLSTLHGPDAQA